MQVEGARLYGVGRQLTAIGGRGKVPMPGGAIASATAARELAATAGVSSLGRARLEGVESFLHAGEFGAHLVERRGEGRDGGRGGVVGCRGSADVGPLALAADDEAVLAEFGQGPFHGLHRHAVFFGDGPLGRELVAGFEAAVGDRGAQRVRDLAVGRPGVVETEGGAVHRLSIRAAAVNGRRGDLHVDI